jgi:hypothetical protein
VVEMGGCRVNTPHPHFLATERRQERVLLSCL